MIEIGGLTLDEGRRVMLDRVLSGLFEAKYRLRTPSRWRENDLILRHLYDAAHVVAAGFVGLAVEDDAAPSDIGAAKRDFRAQLARVGILNVRGAAPTEIRGVSVDVNSYEYSGTYPSSIAEKVDYLSEIEQRFVETMRVFYERVWFLNTVETMLKDRGPYPLDDVPDHPEPYLHDLARWGADVGNSMEHAHDVFLGLTRETVPKFFAREFIEEQTSQATTANEMIWSASPTVVANVLAENIDGLTVGNLSGEPSAFAHLNDALKAELANLPHALLYKGALEKQVLFVAGLNPTVVNRNRGPLGKAPAQHRLVALWDDGSRYSRRPATVRGLPGSEGQLKSATETVERIVKWLER